MAVYRRGYRGYAGPLTAPWTRFLVLYRAARQSLFRSRFQTAFFVIAFFYPLACLIGVYLNEHLSALISLGARGSVKLKVDEQFFLAFLYVQSTFAFLLAAFIGPGVVSPDLANGALTLYLCRPISRSEYILGKMAALFGTLSAITWIPGLVLFLAQAGIAGGYWFSENFWILRGVLLSSLIWIFLLSLLSLVLSAWVKWRVVAGALLLAIFFMGAGFGRAVNAVLDTSQGYLFDLANLINTVERSLLRNPASSSLPAGEAWFALLLISALCVALLLRKVKPNEVVQ